MKAIREVGIGRALRYAWSCVLLVGFRMTIWSPVRIAFLKLCGARIGRDSVVLNCSLMNVDRGGFSALRIGSRCFIGDEALLDLAAPITLEDDVTLSARVMVLTHHNVGFKDHPLQARFPSRLAPVLVRRGSFVGAGSLILAGTTLGPEAFVGASTLVNRDLTTGSVVGGVPARAISAGTPRPNEEEAVRP